jgi:hypothetical protein
MRTPIATLVTRVLAASVGTIAVASGAAACSVTPANPGIAANSACDGSDVAYTNGLLAKLQVDYVEYREDSSRPTIGADGRPTSDPLVIKTTKLHGSGKLCGTAKDQAKCNAEVAAKKALSTDPANCSQIEVPFGYTGCKASYLVTTRGDAVDVVLTDNAFVQKSLTTLGEVLIAANFVGTNYSCQYDLPPTYDDLGKGKYRVVGRTIGGYCGEQLKNIVETSSSDAPGATTKFIEKQQSTQPCAIGRRPEGLCDLIGAGGQQHPVGEFFAEAAKLEAASVHAFATMHRELAALGADAQLLERVESARKDEVRHTSLTVALARRYGTAPKRATIARAKSRSVLEIALENAVEGCVRETYGAVVAAYQARVAQDPAIAAALAEIAVDEAAHAQLSWDVADFLDAQLSGIEREQVSTARVRAAEQLHNELAIDVCDELQGAAGLPNSMLAQSLLAVTMQELLAA